MYTCTSATFSFSDAFIFVVGIAAIVVVSFVVVCCFWWWWWFVASVFGVGVILVPCNLICAGQRVVVSVEHAIPDFELSMHLCIFVCCKFRSNTNTAVAQATCS